MLAAEAFPMTLAGHRQSILSLLLFLSLEQDIWGYIVMSVSREQQIEAKLPISLELNKGHPRPLNWSLGCGV